MAMNMKERMLANLPYKAWMDGLGQERMENKRRVYRYNNLPPDDVEEADRLIRDILGKAGEHVHMEPPVHFDYGRNTEVGDNFFSNYNLTILDVGKMMVL